MTFTAKLGKLLVFVGFVLLVIFMITDQLRRPEYSYLCIGSSLLLVSIYLIRKGASSSTQSDRFKTLKKIMAKKEPNRRNKQSDEQNKNPF